MAEHRVVSTRQIYRGRLLDVGVDRVLEPSGREVEREIIRHPGAAVILAVTAEGNVLFVRQYRHAVAETLIEVPAGTLDPGESPEETARRELVEETGFYPGHLEKLAEFYPSPGVLEEKMHLYFASDLERRTPVPDEDESLEILQIPLDEALALKVGADVRDAKTILALFFLRMRTS
ncbi:MAG TPA: NUDIX hydrolase [Vicinamibacteria bacterium]|nr:NUDIX hydrolase [Vicinamibacteria bacterium]